MKTDIALLPGPGDSMILFTGPEDRIGLAQSKLSLLKDIAQQLAVPGVSGDDLLQVGAVGLCCAIEEHISSGEAELDDERVVQAIRSRIEEYLEEGRMGSVHRSRSRPVREPEEPAQEADLCRALERLEELEHAVISMRMGLGGESARSQSETAQALGISEQTVSRLLRRAQIKIRKHL